MIFSRFSREKIKVACILFAFSHWRDTLKQEHNMHFHTLLVYPFIFTAFLHLNFFGLLCKQAQ